MNPTHKPGDIVPIYRKPFTDEEFEGNAMLIKYNDTKDGLENWLVMFTSDAFETEKNIKIKQ